jgi:hypothetical protein
MGQLCFSAFRCKNLTTGQLCFLAFRSASSGPKQPVVEDQQTASKELSDILPGFLRQLAQVGDEKTISMMPKRNFPFPF